MRTCFAYGPTGQRCERPADHDGDHTVSTTWTDDECVTPEHFAMAKVIGETRTAQPVPIIGVDLDDDEDGEPSLDRCAACGWPEAIHAQNNQGCKNFA